MEEQKMSNTGVDLNSLFRPKSLAVIGASKDFTRGGGFIWWRVNEQGYTGRKVPISRSSKELNGIKCYSSVSEMGEPVELVIIAIPAAAVEGVLAECAEKGVKFAVIHAAGFAELGREGRELQSRILKIAESSGIRVVGPNCMGIFCPDVKLNSIVELDPDDMTSGHVAFSGQSGWATEYFIAGGADRGLSFSTVISSGNQADLSVFDYISYFGNDPQTKVICSYMEGIPSGREFVDLTSKIGLTKPVIIWKAGLSEVGAKAAISHSGSIAGNREIWLGATRNSGIVMAEGFEELMDMAVAFSAPRLPAGKKVGIMAEAGGGGISASDACEKFGVDVHPFSSDLQNNLRTFLKEYLPPFSGLGNPLDLVWIPKDYAMTVCAKSLELIADEVDAVITMSYLPFMDEEFRQEYIEALCNIRDRLNIPIFMVPPYATRAAEGMKVFTAAGLPAFPSFERAVKAVAATSSYVEWVSASS